MARKIQPTQPPVAAGAGKPRVNPPGLKNNPVNPSALRSIFDEQTSDATDSPGSDEEASDATDDPGSDERAGDPTPYGVDDI